MEEEIRRVYEKYVPRWFKVIRWKEFAMRQYSKQYIYFATLYLPVTLYFTQADTNPYPLLLMWYKPETQEERDHLKKKWLIFYNNPFVGRNWELDKYQGQMPPYYDVWERRKKYPEYYGDKYNMFAGDAYCETYPKGYP